MKISLAVHFVSCFLNIFTIFLDTRWIDPQYTQAKKYIENVSKIHLV